MTPDLRGGYGRRSNKKRRGPTPRRFSCTHCYLAVAEKTAARAVRCTKCKKSFGAGSNHRRHCPAGLLYFNASFTIVIRGMNFRQLSVLAAQVVSAVQRRLPAAVRAAAESVPVCYEALPGEALLAEGWEPDILGMFVGHEHRGELAEGTPLPPQILLFLENIWDYAEGDE